ncbi:MAG: preprotein translocase subunit YajC, partial [Polyangiaceae bacterium]
MYSDSILSFSALQPAGPKAGSAAAAQGQESTPPAGAGAHEQAAASPPSLGMAFLLPLLILVPFFLLSSRRQKKEESARQQLKRGDKVVSNAGLVGELVEIDHKYAKVKLAPGITVQMLANTVGPLPADDATPAKSK